jgi:hypothetical protein
MEDFLVDHVPPPGGETLYSSEDVDQLQGLPLGVYYQMWVVASYPYAWPSEICAASPTILMDQLGPISILPHYFIPPKSEQGILGELFDNLHIQRGDAPRHIPLDEILTLFCDLPLSPIFSSIETRLRDTAIRVMRSFQVGESPLHMNDYLRLRLAMYKHTNMGIYHQKGRMMLSVKHFVLEGENKMVVYLTSFLKTRIQAAYSFEYGQILSGQSKDLTLPKLFFGDLHGYDLDCPKRRKPKLIC